MNEQPIEFEAPPEPTQDTGGRQRAPKKFACIAKRNLHTEAGKILAGSLVRLTDDEIWRYADAVERVRGE
jgi:uncharacterized protein YdeI (BOF family)